MNVAISFYRKNAHRQKSSIQLNDEHLPIQDEINSEKQEYLSLLEKFISELNDLDKAIMLLYLEEKRHVEISEIMGVSVTNVGTKLGRIKDKLKKRFSQINS